MKKIIVILSLVFIVSVAVLFSKGEEKDFKNYTNKNADKLSMMLETEAGTGNYEEVTRDAWPTEGYKLNTTLSKCENGGQISWDNEKKIVIMNSDRSEKCFVYFDIYKDITFATYIKGLYTGTQGDNNLYLHDDSLENGANDGSYRYSGPSETVNNFVCFGYDSKNGECPTDNLFRIIGVFDDNVKLIKYDYAKSTLLGTDGDYVSSYNEAAGSAGWGTSLGNNSREDIGAYYWNNSEGTSSTNLWSKSRLNTINLNKNFLNNIGAFWTNKIISATWKVGGNDTGNILTQVFKTYVNEFSNPKYSKTYNAKVGLMYVSDYGYAAAPSAWKTNLSAYANTTIRSNNWLYMGLHEWSITPRTDECDGYQCAYQISCDNSIGHRINVYSFAIRPVLYLNSSVNYVSGIGTSSNPYIIN